MADYCRHLTKCADAACSYRQVASEAQAEVRKRIAADIEAERDRVWIEPNLVLVNGAQVLDRHVYAAQWTEAARIARGQS